MYAVRTALAIACALHAAAHAADLRAIARANEPGVLVITGTRANGNAVQSSGGCIGASGLVISTAHQVEGVGQLTGRTVDGKTIGLTIVEVDPARELALLQADAPLPAALPLGDSRALESGAPLVCIAAPGNLEFSLVSGVVSNVNRSYRGYPVVQTDFRASPGSSGGPVFDEHGNLVGLVIGKLADEEWITVVNPIANAYPMLRRHGIAIPGDAPAAGALELTPAPGIGDTELRAIDAFNRGTRTRDAAERIALYALAAKLLPPFYEAWFNLGVAREGAGDAAGALEAFDRARDLRPADPAVLRSRGRLLLALDRTGDAEAAFAAALEADPSSARAHTELGEAQRRAGRLDEAAALFAKAAALEPGYALAHYNLAVTRAQQQRNADAIAAFEQYLAAAPDAPDAAAVRENIARLKAAP